MLTIRLFARLREATGREGWTIALPPGVENVAQLRAYLCAEDATLAAALAAESRVRVAINQRMSPADGAVRDGDEVAFFPPVTGG